MSGGESEYIINVKALFTSGGIQEILSEARSAFAQLQAEAAKGTYSAADVGRTSAAIIGRAQEAGRAVPGYLPGSGLDKELVAGLKSIANAAKDLGPNGKNLGQALRLRAGDRDAAGNVLAPLKAGDKFGETAAAASARAAGLRQAGSGLFLPGDALRNADKFYQSDKGAEAAARDRALQAARARSLGTSPEAVEGANTKLAAAQLRESIAKVIASNDAYATAMAGTIASDALVEASQLKMLAANDAYAGSLAASAVSQAQIEAGKLKTLAADDQYAKATAAAAISKDRIATQIAIAGQSNAAVEANADKRFEQEKQKRLQNQEYRSLTRPGTAAFNEQIQEKYSQEQRALAERAALAAKRDIRPAGNIGQRFDAVREGDIAASNASRAALTESTKQQMLAKDAEYIKNTAAAAEARNVQAAAISKAAQADGAVAAAASARIEAEAAQRLVNREYRRATLPGTDAYNENISEKLSQERRNLSERLNLAQRRDPTKSDGAKVDAQQEGEAIAAENARAAAVRQSTATELATNAEYIKSKASTIEAEREQAIRTRAAVAGIPITRVNASGATELLATTEIEAATILKERIIAEQRATSAALLAGRSDSALAGELAAVKNARIAAERQAALAVAKAGLADKDNGTRGQRLISRLSLGGANPKAPGDVQSPIQSLSQKALTVAGYAIPSALLFGSLGAISGLVEQAQELEKAMNQITAQFESLNEAGQLPKVKASILEIAKTTGVAADEVANVFVQFKGAFGDTDEALKQTNSAMKIVATTGLSLKEVIDSLTAVSKTYENSTNGVGYSLERLGNIALYIQESFGVASKETLTFVADLAAVGKEAGASVEELAGLGAITQQLTARSGSGLAESFGRVLPAIQDSSSKILALYSDPKLSEGRQKIIQSLSQGDTFDVFKQLLADSAANNLSDGQKKYAVSLLGSRREAQVLIPVFNKAQESLDAMNDTAKEASNPRLQKYFERLQGTVSNTVSRMKEAFKQLGQALFEAGLADALILAATAVGILGGALTGLVKIWNGLNNAVDGWLGKLAAMVGLYKVVTILSNRFTTSSQANAAAIGVQTTVTEGATAATGGLVVAETADAAAKYAETLAAAAATGGIQAQMAAEIAETGVVEINTLTRRQAIATRFAEARAAGAGRLSSGAAGLSAGGVNPYVAAGVAALAVGTFIVKPQFDKNKAASLKSRDKLVKQYKDKDDAELKAIAETHASVWDQTWSTIFGSETSSETASRTLRVRGSAPARTKIRALSTTDEYSKSYVAKYLKDNRRDLHIGIMDFINQEGTPTPEQGELKAIFGTSNIADENNQLITPESFKELEKRSKAGDEFASAFIEYLAKTFQGDDVLAGLIKNYTKEKAKPKDATGIAELAARNSDVAKTAYEAGQIGLTQYLASLNTEISGLQDALSAGTPDPTGVLAKQVAEQQKTLNSLVYDSARATYDSAKAYADVTDTANGKQDLQGLLTLMNTLNPSGDPALTAQQKYELIPDLYAAAQQAFLDEIAGITDPAEQVRRLNEGFKMPPELSRILAKQDLNKNPEYKAAADAAKTALGEASIKAPGIRNFDQYEENAIAAAAGDPSKNVNDLATIEMRKRLQFLRTTARGTRRRRTGKDKAVEAEIKGLEDAISKLEKIKSDTGIQIADDIKLTQDQIAKIDEVMDKDLQIAKIDARNDPVKLAELELQLSERELYRAQQAYRDNPTLPNLQRAQDAELANKQKLADLADSRVSEVQNAITASANLASSRVVNNAAASASIELDAARRQAAALPANASQPDKDNAQATINNALNNNRAARLANLQSMYDVSIAIADASGDAVKSAALGLESARARLAAGLAEGAGVAEINALRAEVIRAEANLRDSFLNVITSQIDLQIAIATAAGDTIQAAALQLKSAQTRLNSAQANGAGVAEINALKAEVVRAEANARDTKFNKELADIQYLIDIAAKGTETGAILVAIQRLQAMAKLATNTEEQNRQIALQIRRLNDQLSADMSLNIPDEIKLPTLYEVRRANQESGNRDKPMGDVMQAPGGGTGRSYVDARNVTVIINESKDGATMMTKIIEAIGGASRNGVAPPSVNSFYS